MRTMTVARRALAAYRHKFSPKKFTQHQLFACLVLKNFLKTDYRGVVKHLQDCPALCEAIELKIGSPFHNASNNYFIYAFHAGRGPRPDVDEFECLIGHAQQRVKIQRLAADAGYDSEPNHRFARQQHGIRTIIPPKHGRHTDKPATGHYRRLMQTRFDTEADA